MPFLIHTMLTHQWKVWHLCVSNTPKNGHLTHIDPKLYIKCPPKMQCHKAKIKKIEKPNEIYNILYIKGHPLCNVTNQRLKDEKSKVYM
jgi:hypothetical protein